MNPAITKMLASYERRSIDEHVNAFREVLQEVTLCGLWRFRAILRERIDNLNVELARKDVEAFLVDPSTISVWSREFFHAVAEKIEIQA